MSNASSIAAGRLYRIMDFSRVVQLFERQELYFAHPTSWDDPFEQRVKHQSSHALFAQCWCQIGISDAMWRIYSQNGMGVRISTTTKKLSMAVRAAIRPLGYGWDCRQVEYLSQHDLGKRTKEIASELAREFNVQKAVNLLYLKREAFRHETEWRAAIYCPEAEPDKVAPGLSVKIDPHKLIDNILLDPRAPKELVDAFQFYFQVKLGYKRRVGPSVLYKSPQPIQIMRE